MDTDSSKVGIPTLSILSHRRPTALPKFLYGCAYYPEHWDETIRASDPAWMKEAGFNCVRMGEFSWDIFECEEGRFDFHLHTEAIDRLGREGILTIFCTPTAAPPAWLTRRYPETLRVDERGIPLQHGSRQHANSMSPVFREHSRRITRALAQHFRDNPFVIGWQTDNEIHCHFSEDHSAATIKAFQDYLRDRYDDAIQKLNQAWGTAFWAQTYSCFEEILTPVQKRPTWVNPAHDLDYRRFLSHGAAEFQREQVEILRNTNSDWFITHNGCFRNLNYRGDFTRDLNFLSYDSYPSFDFDPGTRPASQAFNLDLVRAYSGNFVILEQQSGPGGQGDRFLDNPEPGEMRRLAFGSLARGADGLLFFRERSCRFGAEEYWCGVLDHDNVPRRRYHEAEQLGRELARIGPKLIGTSVEVSVGIAAGDFVSQSGHLPLSLGLPTPHQATEAIHRHFFTGGHAVGCIHPEDSLEGVKVYFIPHLALFEPSWLERWEAWVRAGGALIIGARTGSKDRNNNVIGETLPGCLRGLAGLKIEEYGRQNRPDLRPRELVFSNGTRVMSELWYETLLPECGTDILAIWEGGHLSGTTAITRRNLGAGAVWYVGTYFTPPLLEVIERQLISESNIPVFLRQPLGVTHVVRSSDKLRLHFLLNHTDHEVKVTVPGGGHELVANMKVSSSFSLPVGGVAVVQENAVIST